MLIRFAKPDESAQLSAIALRSKAHWGYSVEFMQACRAELTYTPEQILSLTHFFAVAEVDTTIVGFYVVEQISPIAFELDALFIEPGFMGQGIGRALMEHAKQTAAQKGGQVMTIQSDPNAQGFYESVGATLTDQRESASISGRILPVLTIPL